MKSKIVKNLLIGVSTLVCLVVAIGGAFVLGLYTSPNLFVYLLRQMPDAIVAEPFDEYNEIEDEIEFIGDITYDSIFDDNQLDIYYPKDYSEPLPTVVWIHGGSFIGGDKSSLKFFGSLLASRGFSFVSINYEVAPENVYPGPTIQLGEAVTFLKNNVDTYTMLDMNKVIIGGDSAGGQIAAQYSLVQTIPSLASEMGIEPSLDKDKFIASLLFCGPYDLAELKINSTRLADSPSGLINLFISYIGWSYFGYQDWRNGDQISQTDIVAQVTQDFPPTYLTDGNNISFMEHAEKLYAKLQELGVTSDAYFPSEENVGEDFNHEYQFNFTDYHDAAIENLNRTSDFLSDLI